MNNWAKPELSRDDVIAMLRNRTESIAAIRKKAGYPTDYLFRKDFGDHIGKKSANIPQKRKPVELQLIPRETPARPLPETDVGSGVNLNARLIRAVGLLLGVVGLALNGYFNFSLGQSLFSGGLLAGMGGAIDLLSIILAPAIFVLGEKKQWVSSVICAVIWAVCFLFSLNTGINFSARYRADAHQARSDVVKKAGDLNLAKETLSRARTSDAIELEIIKAEKDVPYFNWQSSKKCTDPTISLVICSEVRTLRAEKDGAMSAAEKRDKLDKLEQEIRSLPSVAAAEPGADLISWLTRGLVTQKIIESCAIVVMALILSLPGFLFAFARKLDR